MLAVPMVFVVLQFNPIMGNLILISGVAALVCICRLKSEVHQIRFKKKRLLVLKWESLYKRLYENISRQSSIFGESSQFYSAASPKHLIVFGLLPWLKRRKD